MELKANINYFGSHYKFPLFLSMNCFKEKKSENIIQIVIEMQAQGLELGYGFKNVDDYKKIVKIAKRHNLNLSAHNHFLPLKFPFVLNLADPDVSNRKKSLDFIIKSLEWCALYGVNIYTFHAGFACSVKEKNLGSTLIHLPRYTLAEAKYSFYECLHIICKVARALDISIAVENNVFLLENKTIFGFNELLLCVTAEDMLDMLNEVNENNLKILLDVGHLKVSAATLGFSSEESLQKISPHIALIHIHDNLERYDSHLLPTRDSWFWPSLECFIAPDVPRVLECTKQSRNELLNWRINSLPG